MDKRKLLELIKSKNSVFTVNQRKFAKYLYDNLDEAAFVDIKTLALKSDVSIATIFRFSKKLGFSGFLDLKKEIKRIILNSFTYINRMDEFPIDKEKKIDDIFLLSLENDKKNIEDILSVNSIEKFKEAISLILKSNKIFFHAFRNSIPSTMQFYYIFKQLNSNSICLMDSLTLFDKLVNIGSSDLLIAVHFSRYSKEVEKVIDYAYEKKSRILYVTDSDLAPRREKANITFTLQHKSLSFFNNYVPTIALFNAILCGLINKNKSIYRKRLKDIDELMGKFNVLDD